MHIFSRKSWVIKFIEGNQESIGDFYAIEFPKLVFFVYSYVHNTEFATDLASQVFSKLLNMPLENRSSQLPRNEAEFKKYVYTSAKNLVIDESRKQKNKLKYEHAVQNELNTTENQENYTINQLKEEAYKNIGNQQQRIFELHVQGFKNQEIAQQLNISENTVKNTLVTTKKKLRSIWKTLS